MVEFYLYIYLYVGYLDYIVDIDFRGYFSLYIVFYSVLLIYIFIDNV